MDETRASRSCAPSLPGRKGPPGQRSCEKGTPDAGVECYAVLSDGAEWAWQSKYIDGLGDSQWSQIDGSIKDGTREASKASPAISSACR